MKLRVLVTVLVTGLVGCAGLAQDAGSPRRSAQLKIYDSALSALVEETMTYTDHQDWRFKYYADAR